MKLKLKIPVTWMVIACLVPFLTGCENMSDYTLTGRLWEEETSPTHYGPNVPPELQLFQGKKDILVEYNEASDKDGITRRAYWLEANRERVFDAKKPHFVKPHVAAGLVAIPVVTNSTEATNLPSGLPARAFLSPDGREFTVISEAKVTGPFRLPIYGSGADHFDRVMLTPVTVVGDVVIYSAVIAAVAGIFYLIAVAGSNSN